MTLLKRFRSSIRRGTGEAVLIMQRHPRVDFSKEILQAAIRTYAYDPQSEGSRGFYLSQLINISPKNEIIVDKILGTLIKKNRNDWSFKQLYNIARIYAQKGNERARKIMYAKMSRNLGDETELLELDGLVALKFVAQAKGKMLARNKNAWEDGWFIDYLKVPGADPKKYLQKAAKRDPDIRKYLDIIRENNKLKKKARKPVYTYRSVKALIESKKNFGTHIGRRLKRTALSRLAADFLVEADVSRVPFYLRVFQRTKFPLHYRHLLKYAAHRNKSIKERAIDALSFFANNEIRAFALKNISASKHPEDFLPLLRQNFRPQDSKLILNIIKLIKNQDVFHSAGFDVLDIYDSNSTRTCLLPLMEMYNRTSCSLCRESAVRILNNNGVLSKKLKDEIKFDSFVEQGPLLPA